jgi:hypothetical protein
MSKTLLDIDNNIISIPLFLVNKSKVLKLFFEKNPDKGFKLEYPLEVINDILGIIRNDENIIVNDILIELCHQLEISDIDNYIDNDNDVFIEESIPKNLAFYVYKHIFLEENKQYYKKKIIKSKVPLLTLSLKDGSTRSFNNYQEAWNIYQKEYNDYSAPRETIMTQNRGETICFKIFNIGRLVKDKLPDIELNKVIFNFIIKLLIKYYEEYNRSCRSENYHIVLGIQKNYEKFIVKFKIAQFFELKLNGNVHIKIYSPLE